jgi:tetratricopeptide (TPR) repeat protein
MEPSQTHRRLLLVAGAVLILAAAGWLGFESWSEDDLPSIDAREEIARRIGDPPLHPASPVRRAGPLRLAVGPLGLGAAGSPGAERDTAALLEARLSGEPGVVLLERREVGRILNEIQLGAAGAVKPAEALRVGRLLHADGFLLGAPYRGRDATNAVVRLVDADTGQLRELSVLSAEADPTEAAETLVGLVRAVVRGETDTRAVAFVGVGGFEDLSVRPRHPGLESELRSHLTAALRIPGRRVVERELTTLLLDEQRLQLAGLVESGSGPSRFQGAFWLVDGRFQSFEADGDRIELSLRLTRVGGEVERTTIRARRGAELDAALVAGVEALAARKPSKPPVVTRKGEVRAQMRLGQERAGLDEPDLIAHRWFWKLRSAAWNDSEATKARRQGDLEAAIAAFRTVLLLDPENAGAKLYLARCLLEPAVDRIPEAIALHQELLGHRVENTADIAEDSLGFAWLLQGEPERAAEWFRSRLTKARPSRRAWIETEYGMVRGSLSEPTAEPGSEARREREERLGAALAQWRDLALAGKPFHYGGPFSDFLAGRAEGREVGIAHLVEVFPRVASGAGEIRPYLLLRVLRNLERTNTPIQAELVSTLTRLRADPTNVFAPGKFYTELREHLGPSESPGFRDLSLPATEALLAARAAGVPVPLEAAHKVRIGYVLVGAGRVEEAMAWFKDIPEPVVAMDSQGPWGPYPAFVIPENRVRACHRQLGRTMVEEPEFLDLPKAHLVPDRPFVFRPDGDRLWIATGNQLVEHPLGGGTSVTNLLGVPDDLLSTAMEQSGDTLWIATDGAGLVEFDKRTRKVRRRTSEDGLLFDRISALHLSPSGRELWIGYATKESGGVSRLSLDSGRIETFTPELVRSVPDVLPAERRGAPRRPVHALASFGDDRLWVGVDDLGLLELDRTAGSWTNRVQRERFSETAAMAVNPEWIVCGTAPHVVTNYRGEPFLSILPRRGGSGFHLGVGEGLPIGAVTAVALDGDRLWIGGPSYLALMDLNTRKILKRSLMNSTFVSQISLQGDDLWVRLNRAIYRFPRRPVP